MLNTSLRRVARTCTGASSPVHSRPSTPTIASFTSNAHQRRHSSSKPPVPPNNGSAALPPAVKQAGAPSGDSDPVSTESRSSKRKSAKEKLENKNTSDYHNWASTLPSVPSLQHMNPRDVYSAAFYGTHRPLFISGPVYSESSMEAVDKVFQPKPKRSRTASQDVIYTLSSAVDTLDEQITNKRAEQKAHLIKALVQGNNAVDSQGPQHLDGAPQSINPQAANVRMALQEIARRFRPYNVPPPPVPIQDPEANSNESRGDEGREVFIDVEIQEEGSEPYVQRIVIGNQQAKEMDTSEFFTSNTATAIGIESPVDVHQVQEPGAEEVSIRGRRQGIVVPNRFRHPKMYAISVKRQRRLKMKKHKFKKLTRRLRTLRIRQGKI